MKTDFIGVFCGHLLQSRLKPRLIKSIGYRAENRQNGTFDINCTARPSLTTTTPLFTVGSYWPYATTVWDYIRRAMPYDRPGSLQTNEIYAVTAYVLFLNGIIGRQAEISNRTLPLLHMPNRDGFDPDRRPDVRWR